MKILYSLLAIAFFYENTFSQCTVSGGNLIPNPSFELTTAFCNGADNQVYFDQSPLQNWIGTDPLSVGGSTPDITRNDATTCGSSVNAANNNCFTGVKCAGIFVYTSSTGREYIQTALTTPLTAVTTYCFSMTVRSRYGGAGNILLNTDGIGAHFRNGGAINIQTMNGGIQFLGPGSTLNFTPQVQQPAGTAITSACTIVTGTFVATGGENRVIIGNFRSNAATTLNGAGTISYMYIDDVRLYPVTVLPVELTSFNAHCNNRTTLLNWTTESEKDNDYFTIEKSCDGFQFEKMKIIPGGGNSTTKLNYSLIDENPCIGTTYYRLSQTDVNGTTEIVALATTECSSYSDLLVYPNPATTAFSLSGNLQHIEKLQLFSTNGELVRDYSTEIAFNKNNSTFDLKGITSGLYLLRLEKEGGNPTVFKLIIQ